MTTEKSTGAREELVSFGEQNLLLGFLTIPSCDGKAPAVIAAHGFAGTKSQRKFVEMGRIFAEKGIAFLRFDFSGCGDSDGNPADISIGKWASDFSFAYDFLCARKEIDASRIGFLGYSLGAVIVCLCATRSNIAGRINPAKALVLVAPALDQKGLMKLWHTPVQMNKWQRQGYLDTPKGRLGAQYLHDAVDYTYLPSEVDIPTLIIRGGKDEDVPGRFTKKAFDALSCEKRLATIKEADHGFENHQAKEQLIARSLGWFTKYL